MTAIGDRFRDVGGKRGGPIRGVTSKRAPNRGALKPAGGHLTNVPRQATSQIFREYHFQQVRNVRGQFAGGWGFAWQGLAEVSANVIHLNENIHEGIAKAAESLKDEMVAYAQTNYTWTPRDDDKRGSDSNLPHAHEAIQGAVVWESPETFSIYLGHGSMIYYGIWLEVRWGGRYAIILPTIEMFAPQLGGRIAAMT